MMMRTGFLAAMLLLLAPAAGAQQAGSTSVAPAEAYGRLPAISSAAISPDGQRVALAMSSPDGQSRVGVLDLATGRVAAAAVPAGGQLRGVDWANDQYVAFLMSQTFRPGEVLPPGVNFRGSPRRIDYFRTGLLDVAANRTRLLTTDEENPWADQGAALFAPLEGDSTSTSSFRCSTDARTKPATFGSFSCAFRK